MKLFSPQIKAAIGSLRAGLPGRIAVFNGEAGNPQLAVPADNGGALGAVGVNYHFGGKPRHAPPFPHVEVAVPDGSLTNFTLGNVSGDLADVVIVTVWVDAPAEDFPGRYERALGYARCVTEVLVQEDAFGASAIIDWREGRGVRYAFAANPDRRERGEMEHFTIGAFMFFNLADVESRPL